MEKVNTIDGLDVQRVGLYVRISEQDRKKLTKTQLSKSIENQITMLKDEAFKREWEIIDIYCDEDISGADQTRPEFNRLLRDCENKKIDIVLCKSQDRFARNMEIIEKYLHNKFIEWGIRFVTIVDNADTDVKENKKNRQITGLTNEWYLEDLSNNIKTTLNNKMLHGDYIGSFAPYGYQKQRDLKNAVHLIIDPVAANVVKRIFDEYTKGNSMRAISRGLNRDGILSPSEYKWYNGQYLSTPTKIVKGNNFEKTGNYLIKTSFFNENLGTDEIIIQFSKFSYSNELMKKNSQIMLYKTNAKEVFYTTKSLDEETILESIKNNNIWNRIKTNDCIPTKTTYIYCIYGVQKKYSELYTTFDLCIEENVNKSIIKFDTCSFNNSIKSTDYFKTNVRYKSCWGKRTITNIISNPVYIGTLVQGKSTTVSYKNHTIIKIPQNKWKIVDNAHDAIIDMETWAKAQDRRIKQPKAKISDSVNEFGGVLKCSYCGKSFISTKCGRKDDKNRVSYYACSDRDTHFSNCINNKMIRKDELIELTLNEINKMITLYKDDDKINEVYKQLTSDNSNYKSKYDALNLEKKEIVKTKEKNLNYIKKLFESRANGLIDDDEYFEFKKTYKQDNDEIDIRIKSIDKELEMIIKKRDKIKNRDLTFAKYEKIIELNYEIVHDFISEIKIGTKNDDKTRKIEFLWNF